MQIQLDIFQWISWSLAQVHTCIKIYLKRQYSITAGTVFTVASTSIYWSAGQWQYCKTKWERDRDRDTERERKCVHERDRKRLRHRQTTPETQTQRTCIWLHVLKKQKSPRTHAPENDRSIPPVTTEVCITIITHAMQKHCSHVLIVTLSPGQCAKKASTLCEW